MIKLLLTSTIATVLLFLVSHRFTTETAKPVEKPHISVENPIDRILGEHWYDNGTLRKDNFDSILHISATHLLDSSEHYKITELRKNLFLLKRKKFYLDNRRYSLIVETKQKQILSVHSFVDLDVKDALWVDDNLFIIQGDYTEIASPWKPAYRIKISCLDSSFRELWNISSVQNKGVFFLAYDLRLKGNELIARFGVQEEGSSTMCVSDYIVLLSKSGEIRHFQGAGGYMCGSTPGIPVAVLNELFQRE